VSRGENWSHSESQHQINYLEMFAILLGLQSLAKDKSNTHIRIMCDHATAVNVSNHMGQATPILALLWLRRPGNGV